MSQSFLFDEQFLLDLDNSQEKEAYAKIIALTKDELPIEQIEGKVTGGSVSVDGTSAVRRTCSLSMVAKDVNIDDYYWGLNNKFKLELGLRNKINPKYPDIIWFKMGTYVITSFNTSLSVNSYNINISGKDKMCLLNGDLAGSLMHTTEFHTVEIVNEDGTISFDPLNIREIIFKAVQELGGEMPHNIIINDVEESGLDLLEYKGDQPLYFFKDVGQDIVTNMVRNENQKCWYWGVPTEDQMDELGLTYEEQWIPTTVKMDKYLEYDRFFTLDDIQYEPTIIITSEPDDIKNKDANNTRYTVSPVEYGTILGYRETELVYPGELIGNIGSPITGILDKVQNMLGDFEYFYDLDGRFVFRKRPYAVRSTWEQFEKQTDEVISTQVKSIYNFVNGKLINSFSNNPDLMNIRNDFSVWGILKSSNGTELPIHARYAIDEKPFYYKAYPDKDGIQIIYTTDKNTVIEYKNKIEKEANLEILGQLENFELQYPTYELDPPIKLPGGGFTAGWWDIRDWAEYYKILTGTYEDPKYTMKWYSKNNADGCVPVRDLNIGHNNSTTYAWLVIRNKNGTYNLQHGSGNPSSGGYNCTLYESVINENGTLKTTQVKDENNQSVKKYFIYPYAGCNDTHTYLEFLKDDVEKQGNTVYFYNPNFPNQDPDKTYDEIIQEKIDALIEQKMKNIQFKYVDWREIIFQMQRDYRKHFHSDPNFLYEVANNNPDLYPTGRTGYEQYYIDIEGFWRNLYDPNPNLEQESVRTDILNDENEIIKYEHIMVKNPLRPIREIINGVSEDLKGYDYLDKLYILADPTDQDKPGLLKVDKKTFIPFKQYCKLENTLFNLSSETAKESFTNEEAVYYYLTTEGRMNQGTTEKDRLNAIDINELYVHLDRKDYSYTQMVCEVLGVLEEEGSKNYIMLKTASSDPNKQNLLFVQKGEGDTGGIMLDVDAGNLTLFKSKDSLLSPKKHKGQIYSFGLPKEGETSIIHTNKIKYIWKKFLWLKKHYPEKFYIKTYLPDEEEFVKVEELNSNVLDIYVQSENGKIKKYNQYLEWLYTDNYGDPKDINEIAEGVQKRTVREMIPYHGAFYNYNRDAENANFWAKSILENPEILIFWFDFLDARYSDLGKYSVKAIGQRTKPINDDDVKAIYYRNIPNVIFRTTDLENNSFDRKPGYVYINLDNSMESLFAMSSKGKSAKERIDELLYDHACCQDSINITAIPVYYLEPNNKIFVRDENSGINGDYIISRLTYNLNYNGTMSITATKTVDRLT